MFVSLFVHLSVCLQDNPNATSWDLPRRNQKTGVGPTRTPLSFESHPDHHLDTITY